MQVVPSGRRKKFCHCLSVPGHSSFPFFSPISSVFLCLEYERGSLCFTAQSTVTVTTELQPSPSTTASTVLPGEVHQHCYHNIQHVLQLPGQISQPGYLPLLSLDRFHVLRGIRNRMVPTKSSS